MKKLLLSICIVASTAVFAQRNIDWSTDAIVSPTNLNSTTSGTSITLEVVFKNNGTSSTAIGDSVLWQFFVTPVGGNTIVLGYPSATNLQSFAFFTLNKVLAPSDTIHFKITLSTTTYTTISANITMIVNSFLQNRTNLIASEGNSTTSNNAVTKNMIWYNQQAWAVGVNEIEKTAQSVNVYPNPAKDIVNFSMDGNIAKTITVIDITGRIVETVKIITNETQMNIGDYSNGIYIYQIKAEDGQVIKSGKFNVSK